ncbi:MAG: hypothetical protein LC102_12075 [Ignavibacteriales bacterium]|nr:MAG: hypothetical protein F9K26_11225 [Ignavibacteriaceae bacterium]MBW7873812.1 hypothetical protein [Ignavibacteria bacterium]MCZ2144149.1 hypothetical protein [Ignavibacteriales bacterium]OQY76272.1 MAG: hypothetical protein B6D45_04150 [Ignavibacteriales bacterium UTCHB3]MBV6445788.1 hypothetical protein [Ignavibacteriaceae bacterium]
MRILQYLLILLFPVFIWNCRSTPGAEDTSAEGDTTASAPAEVHDKGASAEVPGKGAPTDIQINKTSAIVQILSIDVDDETSYTARVSIIRKFEDPAYPDLAVEHGQYEIKPNFRLDDNGNIMDNEENAGLKAFSQKSKGDQARIEMFMTKDGWLLNKVIK